MSNQPINLIFSFICVSILKLIFKKGHKSHALRFLCILFGLMVSAGFIAYFMNYSTEEKNKVSFKAAGMRYKQQYTIAEVMSLPELPFEEKQRKNTSSSALIRDGKNQTFINKNSLVAENERNKNVKKSTLSHKTQVSALEDTGISLDLQVLSSFNCVESIPTVLVDYISKMFINEYGRSHKDIHFVHKIDQTIPLLKQFNINCGVDQNCSALFQYDKQYGLETTADKTYQRNEVFYCCPSINRSANETISNLCKRAQTVARKSVFRESKKSIFLERVIELVS